MKRKVIRQNKTTFVISLPIKWVKQNNIEKGDELEVLENDDSLQIKKENKISLSTTIDLILVGTENEKKRIIRTQLNQLYRNGFSQIKINIKDIDKIYIYNLMKKNTYLGFEILSDTQGLVELSSLVNPQKEDFEKLSIKLFLTIGNILRERDLFVNQKETIERLCLYLRRIITLEKLPKEYDSLIKNCVLISHSIKRAYNLDDNYIFPNDIVDFFNLVFLKYYNNKIKYDSISKKYDKLEKEILNSNSNKTDIFEWEIIRNIFLSSIQIQELLFLKQA